MATVSPKTSALAAIFARSAFVCIGVAACTPKLVAQDRIVLKGGVVQEGKITGVDGTSVQMTVPNGKTAFDLAQIDRVDAAAPPAYTSGMAAYQAGAFDKALTDLKPVADTFHGLPTEWARQALTTTGSIYLDKNDVPHAEAAFADYRKYYPAAAAGSLALNVAAARLSFAKNNAAQARQQLGVITQQAMKSPAEVTRADGAAYGQAFFLLAKLQEHDGKFQDALEDYLRVVTVFYQDGTVSEHAQKNADDLRAQHKDLHAP